MYFYDIFDSCDSQSQYKVRYQQNSYLYFKAGVGKLQSVSLKRHAKHSAWTNAKLRYNNTVLHEFLISRTYYTLR
jgi:hypothetical protein